MTVTGKGTTPDHVYCRWFYEGKLEGHEFHSDALVKANPDAGVGPP
jgi:uncharacterized protein YodC (DUF2158 family)